jgi:hypothetical protein
MSHSARADTEPTVSRRRAEVVGFTHNDERAYASAQRSAARGPPNRKAAGRRCKGQRAEKGSQGAGSIPDGLRNASAGDGPRADRIICSTRRFVIPGEAGRAAAPGTRDLAADIVPEPVQSFLTQSNTAGRTRLASSGWRRRFRNRSGPIPNRACVSLSFAWAGRSTPNPITGSARQSPVWLAAAENHRSAWPD